MRACVADGAVHSRRVFKQEHRRRRRNSVHQLPVYPCYFFGGGYEPQNPSCGSTWTTIASTRHSRCCTWCARFRRHRCVHSSRPSWPQSHPSVVVLAVCCVHACVGCSFVIPRPNRADGDCSLHCTRWYHGCIVCDVGVSGGGESGMWGYGEMMKWACPARDVDATPVLG